jgi:hypothetical protein
VPNLPFVKIPISKELKMKIRLGVKTFVVLFVSYLIMRILYDRIAFGYIDLRVWALLELLVIPAGLTLLFLTVGRIVRLHVS